MVNQGPTRKTGEDQLNEFNIVLRSQPWYQEWFAQRGLNPNKVKLSRGQQAELENLMARNGMRVQGGMHIDQAGNLNQKNRLVRNTAIAAGIAAGGYFAAPAIASAMGGASIGGGATAGVGAGVGAGGGTAAAAGGTMAALGSMAPYAGMGMNFLGNYLNGRAEGNQRDDDRDFTAGENQKTRDFQSGESQKERDARAAEAQRQREADQNKLIADFLNGNLGSDVNEQMGRSRMALDSTQMDPYAHAKYLNAANVRRSFGAGVDKSGYFKGNYDLSALDPSNLQKVGRNFYDIADEARRGPAGWEGKKQSERDKIMEYLRRYGGGAA